MTDRRRNVLILLLVAGLLAASAAVIATKPTKLGLDLKGGVELIYQAKPTKQSEVTPDALNRAIDIMRDRVDQLGVAEPEIQRSGGDQIQVSLPDVANAERAEQQVGQVAQMFFYDWEPNVIGPDGEPAPNDANVTGGPNAGNPAAGISLYDAVVRASKRPAQNEDSATHNGLFYLVDTKQQKVVRGPEETRDGLFAESARKAPGPGQEVLEVKPGTVIVRAETPDGATQKIDRWFVLNDRPALSGTDIKNPEQNFDNGAGGSGQPIVTFDFTSNGRKIWRDVTREIAQRGAANQIPGQPAQASAQHFAIVLDNELVSVPFIDFQQNPDGIDAANGSQIEGGFTIQSAKELTNLLKTGALPLKLELISQSQVSATLGQQALDQGLVAGIAGFLVVCIFLVLFYRVLGLIAVGGLMIYAVYFFALIKLIPVTLTLPGIAGLVLTIGVAADANIVIFERIKEEVRAGRSVPAAIAAGYKKGLAAIIDANVVTIMVAFILFILATSGVKGFAFTLGVGTLVSLFTAVLATSAVLGLTSRSKFISRPSALGVGERHKEWKFDFMGASKWFFSVSGVILAVGAIAIATLGIKFGIDFESGTRVTTALVQPADENAVRDLLESRGFDSIEVQKVSNQELGDNAFQVSGRIEPNEVPQVKSALEERFGGTRDFSNQSIGPTFGETVAKSAIIAIIASLLVISVYIALRFEWKYAVPVVIALLHDLMITGGVYALTGREVTTATVAALLTILGYSLYDSIIVFDRIRENVPRMPRAAFSQIVNRSLSEVVVRSLVTSLSTGLPILALLLFGGETLKDFAFALLIGVLSGAYSSLFIATPILVHWKERESVYETRAKRIKREHGGLIPAYATAAAGAPSDVEPGLTRRRRRRPAAPEVPGQAPQVSREEFDEMVRDLPSAEGGYEPEPGRARAADDVADEPAARRSRSTTTQRRKPAPARAPEPQDEPALDAEEDAAVAGPSPADGDAAPDRRSAEDASPEDVVMPKPDRPKSTRRPRNKRHGRPR